MKNFKSKNLSKFKTKMLGKIVFMSILLIGGLTFFWLDKFDENISKQLVNIAEAEINKVTYSFITDKINNNVLNANSLNNLLIINKNDNNEILYVDFNLDQAYKVLDKVSTIMTESIDDLENGNISISYLDNDLTHNTNGMVLSIPLGAGLNSSYFYNLGPKIPVTINFVGMVLTNLKTKVTNYGLNNALVEMFVYVEFKANIISPLETKDIVLKYDAVISSMMIEGEVPNFYNGSIESASNIYTKSVE